jgi:hypothetical protein
MNIRYSVLLAAAVCFAGNAFAETSEIVVAPASPQNAAKALASGDISYVRDIKPILHDYCVSCHAPKESAYIKTGLDLTSYETMMKGTRFGPVVIPGNSETSTLTKLLTGTNKGLKMPMGLNSTGTLDHAYILVLKKWVAQGAKNN